MTRYFSELSRCLRSTLMVCSIAAGCAWSDAGIALARIELFQATAPLADRSEAAQTAAFQSAMKSVLVRVTGARSVDEDPALAPLIANARRYVQQYRPAPDSQLMVAFDGQAIERWLTQNGQPLWGRDRPATFVWLTVAAPGQAAVIVTTEDTSELKIAIDSAAALRGLPLIWPTPADLQNNHIDAATVTAAASLNEIAHRAGADGVLFGRANGNTAAAGVRWTHVFQDRSSEYSGTLEGVNRAADLYVSLFAASGNLVPLDIEITGVNDLRDYATAVGYLESLTFISHVSVVALHADTVRLQLATRGGADSLQRALALTGRLEPTGTGENGIPRFQVHH
jgi:hypothetical protein